MNWSGLSRDLPKAQMPTETGEWFNIRWKPNLSTGEVLNLGVAFRGRDGRLTARVLDSFDRIQCLYDEEFAESAQFLTQVVREAIARGRDLPSPNVYLSDPKTAQGVSASAILDQLYQATVSLALPRNSEKAAKSKPVYSTSEQVRDAVFKAIRLRVGINAERVLQAARTMEVPVGDAVHYLDIHLRARSALGTIVSAKTAKFQTADYSMRKAETDLLVAQRRFSGDRLLMYVVRSESESPLASQFDRQFDEYAWKLGQIGIAMRVSTDPEQTAEDVIEDLALA